MFKNKLIKELRDDVNWYEKRYKSMTDEIASLRNKLLEQEETRDKKNREQILKEYDVAILIKEHKTYLLQKGEKEKRLRSFTLSQIEGSYPTLEIEKVLY